MKIINQRLSLLILAFLFLSLASVVEAKDKSKKYWLTEIKKLEITSFPEEIDNSCRKGKAKLFDECTDQVELFNNAMRRASVEDKVLLVSYGAEWCIWCHVFDSYITGKVNRFTYTYGEPGNDKRWTDTLRERATKDVYEPAYHLAKFVSDNFVVVHIDYEHSPNGDDVVSLTSAWESYEDSIPYIYTVDKKGQFAAASDHDEAEVRRDTADWYRGYDRDILLRQLKEMHDLAQKQGTGFQGSD